MLTLPSVRDEGAPASAGGALCAFDRDDDAYWRERPRDHGPNGLYRDGPQEARPMTARLAELTRARCAETAEPPAVARGRMASDRRRRLRLLNEGTALHAKAHARLVAATRGAFSRSRPARVR